MRMILMMNNLNELSIKVHQNAKDKGFWDNIHIYRQVMLILSELGEAVEALRKGRNADREKYASQSGDGLYFEACFEAFIKDSFEDELADTFIRILDICGFLKCDLSGIDEQKVSRVASDFRMMETDERYKVMTVISMHCCELKFKTALALILALCKMQDVDLEWHVSEKMKYNAGRERLHGKKF
jgi:NTP pyrophosphatase (non-canonical NTP hydrolase)